MKIDDIWSTLDNYVMSESEFEDDEPILEYKLFDGNFNEIPDKPSQVTSFKSKLEFALSVINSLTDSGNRELSVWNEDVDGKYQMIDDCGKDSILLITEGLKWITQELNNKKIEIELPITNKIMVFIMSPLGHKYNAVIKLDKKFSLLKSTINIYKN